MDCRTREYLARIGRRGGRQGRRTLTSEQATQMVKLREARRAYRRFHTACFWSSEPDYRITAKDLDWVIRGLMEFGGRAGWEIGARLCR